MEKYLFNLINHYEYIGIVSILDQETRTKDLLSEIMLPGIDTEKKLLVDLALKTGLGKYRFIAFNIDESGKIIFEPYEYLDVKKEVKKIADFFLKQKRDIVSNSFLTDVEKKEILE